MASFNETLQNMVNQDYSTLVAFGKKALGHLLPACKAVDQQNNGLFMASSIILTAIGADGVLSTKERQFLRDVLGLSDDAITKYIKMYDSRMVDLVNTFADRSSSEIKGHTMMLVMSVCACDEKITREETAFIRKILE
jgi:uncharacterized tellurite resistance protein B-like protein